MIIITYDISNNKLRTQFSKFLERYGYRLQCSVFEIRNSRRLLKIICEKIEGRFVKQFDGGDSVFIFETKHGKARKYGNAIHSDKDLVIL
jgi:CRISPR-associated protein Cas2